MMKRRVFLGGAVSAAALSRTRAARAAEQNAAAQTSEPLVWPVISGPQPGIRSFAGHANTVLDIAGRIGTPPSLVIYSEGNHLMVLLGEDIAGAFPAWAKAQPQYADLNLDNVVVVTLPQPTVVQMVRTGAIALGNLTLDLSRASGLYPDIVMGGPAPLRELRTLGVLEAQARYFSKNRGRALLDEAQLTPALDEIWQRVRRLNRYVEERQPWVLARSQAAADQALLDTTLYTLADCVRSLAVRRASCCWWR